MAQLTKITNAIMAAEEEKQFLSTLSDDQLAKGMAGALASKDGTYTFTDSKGKKHTYNKDQIYQAINGSASSGAINKKVENLLNTDSTYKEQVTQSEAASFGYVKSSKTTEEVNEERRKQQQEAKEKARTPISFDEAYKKWEQQAVYGIAEGEWVQARSGWDQFYTDKLENPNVRAREQKWDDKNGKWVDKDNKDTTVKPSKFNHLKVVEIGSDYYIVQAYNNKDEGTKPSSSWKVAKSAIMIGGDYNLDPYDIYSPTDKLRNWWNKYHAAEGTPAFDTGGYTGDWNSSEGKMAILHEKEIVLNKTDTENLLSAVDIVRSLETSMLNRLGSMAFSIGAAMQGNIGGASPAIEQVVHITADFPNVQSHNEIEQAFNDLINMASQRVHKNSRI